MLGLQRLGPPGLALLIGISSGALGYLINMPLPWMLGSMIGVTAAAMLRMPISAPDRLRPIVVPIIGVMLGSAITAEIWGKLGQWTLTLALLPFVLLTSAAVSYAIYRRIGKYDQTTAFYSSMPGGLNEMLLMGAAAGGDERRIALAHAARVLLVILMVALVFGIFLGVRSGTNTAAWTAVTTPTLQDYAILIGCMVAGIPLGKLARLPAAPVFGPMILSGVTHLIGWVSVPPPTIFIIGAQIVIGTIIGCRFIGATLKEISRDLALACLATVFMLLAAGIFALLTLWTIGMPISQAFLAFAPGGLTEMSLLTLAIGQDVAFVSVVHLIRITLVIAIAPALFTAFMRKAGLAKGQEPD